MRCTVPTISNQNNHIHVEPSYFWREAANVWTKSKETQQETDYRGRGWRRGPPPPARAGRLAPAPAPAPGQGIWVRARASGTHPPGANKPSGPGRAGASSGGTRNAFSYLSLCPEPLPGMRTRQPPGDPVGARASVRACVCERALVCGAAHLQLPAPPTPSPQKAPAADPLPARAGPPPARPRAPPPASRRAVLTSAPGWGLRGVRLGRSVGQRPPAAPARRARCAPALGPAAPSGRLLPPSPAPQSPSSFSPPGFRARAVASQPQPARATEHAQCGAPGRAGGGQGPGRPRARGAGRGRQAGRGRPRAGGGGQAGWRQRWETVGGASREASPRRAAWGSPRPHPRPGSQRSRECPAPGVGRRAEWRRGQHL